MGHHFRADPSGGRVGSCPSALWDRFAVSTSWDRELLWTESQTLLNKKPPLVLCTMIVPVDDNGSQ